jgi:hypothetical protein
LGHGLVEGFADGWRHPKYLIKSYGRENVLVTYLEDLSAFKAPAAGLAAPIANRHAKAASHRHIMKQPAFKEPGRYGKQG